MPDMTAPRTCPQCGAELRAKALGSLCPKCLAMVTFDLGSENGRTEAAGARPRPRLRYLGDYELVEEIGRGGMGVVYEAEQMSLHRRVALKMLPFAAVMDSRQLQRFQNEAVAAASLKHPNIVQVYSVGCERGVHYYAMEYVEGQTLAQVIQRLRQSDRAPKTEAAAKKQDKKGSNEKGKPERAKPARAAAKSSA